MHGCINPQVLAEVSPLFLSFFLGWLVGWLVALVSFLAALKIALPPMP
jgi:hypothetical protein